MKDQVLTLRELNRATLERQMLLRRQKREGGTGLEWMYNLSK